MIDEGHGSKEHLRESAIAALLSSPSIPAAAAKVGVDESTLDRWLKLPEFKQAYQSARRRLVEQALAALQNVMLDAVNTLADLLQAEEEGVRCRAAIAIIKHGVAAAEWMDLEARVSALEARQIVSDPVPLPIPGGVQ